MSGAPTTSSLTGRAAVLPVLVPALLAPVLVVVGMAVATHSVVRYKLWIVAVYVALAALLGAWVAVRRGRPGARFRRPSSGGGW